MSTRADVHMTDEEIADLLGSSRTVHVGTLNRDGSIHLQPMWYAMVDGSVVFWTYTRSQKIRNLERDPRITVMAETGFEYGELRGVQISGRAQLSTDPAAVLDIGERLYSRYFGTLDDAAREGVAYSGRKRTRVTVDAERVISWDHRRLGGALPGSSG
jgi:PPOX class probable F420-dependent enzyme